MLATVRGELIAQGWKLPLTPPGTDPPAGWTVPREVQGWGFLLMRNGPCSLCHFQVEMCFCPAPVTGVLRPSCPLPSCLVHGVTITVVSGLQMGAEPGSCHLEFSTGTRTQVVCAPPPDKATSREATSAHPQGGCRDGTSLFALGAGGTGELLLCCCTWHKGSRMPGCRARRGKGKVPLGCWAKQGPTLLVLFPLLSPHPLLSISLSCPRRSMQSHS